MEQNKNLKDLKDLNVLNEGILDFNKLDSNTNQKITPNYKVKKIDKTCL